MKRIQAVVEVLSAEEIRTIHKSSLRILEKTGIRIPHEECLARYPKAWNAPEVRRRVETLRRERRF